nr:AAA family ATPase [Mycobacterium sp. OAS707]
MDDCALTPLDWRLLGTAALPNSVIPGLINEGESGSLVAQAGAGKSLLMLEMAVNLALGRPILGEPTREPVPVMYVDMENTETELANRLRSMGHEPATLDGAPLQYFSFPDLPPLDTVAGGRRLALVAEQFNPTLIILDTISRLVEGKEDSADTWRNLYNCAMLPLRRQGRTVLRLDHQGHDLSKGARGSSAKRDDVDVAWILKRRENNVTLTLDKGRGLGHPQTISLRRYSEPTRHLLASTTTTTTKVSDCAEALEALGVPLGATRDHAGKALRERNYKFGNEVLGQALRLRSASASCRTEGPH